jgi:hypothetical protein
VRLLAKVMGAGALGEYDGAWYTYLKDAAHGSAVPDKASAEEETPGKTFKLESS